MATKGFVIIKTEVMEVKGKRTMVEGLGVLTYRVLPQFDFLPAITAGI
jgi:hypothetical protein